MILTIKTHTNLRPFFISSLEKFSLKLDARDRAPEILVSLFAGVKSRECISSVLVKAIA